MMAVWLIQLLVGAWLGVALLLWAIYFPDPSPWVRRWLPPRQRWPEQGVRDGIRDGRLPPAFQRYFNRDPERVPPPGDGFLAPADGLVTSAQAQGDTRYLVIALSFWDMHVQRSPVAGVVRAVTPSGTGFMDGEGRDFAFLRDKPCPVQTRVQLDTASGQVAVRLITSLSARRIETWAGVGDSVARGQRLGRILLGSTVVLELPVSARLRVLPGERVRAGETVVADAVTMT